MTQTFRYGVLGSGMQGTAAGYDFARHGDASEVLFLDRDAALAKQAADRVNALVGRAGRGAPPWTRATRTRSRAPSRVSTACSRRSLIR